MLVNSSAVLKAPQKMHAANEPAEREKSEAEIGARPADEVPEPNQQGTLVRATMPLIWRRSLLRLSNEQHVLEMCWEPAAVRRSAARGRRCRNSGAA